MSFCENDERLEQMFNCLYPSQVVRPKKCWEIKDGKVWINLGGWYIVLPKDQVDNMYRELQELSNTENNSNE